MAVRQKKASEFHRRDGGRSHPYSAILPLDVFEENPATQIHRKYIFFCKSLLQATMDKQLNKLQKDRQVVVANEYSSSTFHQNKTTSILHRDKT